MTFDLFASLAETDTGEVQLGAGTTLLRSCALRTETEVLRDLSDVTARAPFRHMITPGGFRMSVGMTNCGTWGWVTDRNGYRYDQRDPESGQTWPKMPEPFLELARDASARAGFRGFSPDACLINRYEPGAKLSLHQDRNEKDMAHPIVSVSLGIPATFLLGGMTRSERAVKLELIHGDVLVWGGPDRLRYHGVMPLKEAVHPLLGRYRINLTFRKAGE
jgi:alkylated DNA repair protein (DNA oxidative demethylase)